MAVNLTDLFTRLGKIFHAQETLFAALATTVPAEVEDVTDEYTTVGLALRAAVDGLPAAVTQFQGSGSGLASALRSAAMKTLIAMVEADNPQENGSVATYLEELIAQMQGSTDSVDANAVGASASAGGDNHGNGVLVVSTKRGDGLVNENIIAEDLVANITSAAAPAVAMLRIQGVTRLSALSCLWPGGSGANRALQAVDAAGNLLTNSDFEDEDDIPNAPDDWIVAVGTIGTTLKMTDVEVQTIVVTDSPSAGWYRINWVNPGGKTLTTVPLAYDATGDMVQAALRKLEGLGLVSVATTGTSPNFTHTITFHGVGGNLNQVSVTNGSTGGTFTPGTTANGSTHVFQGGKALEYDSNGSELTEIRQRVLNLSAETPYAFNGWFKVDSVPAAGVLTVDLYDGSAVINDSQGTANSFTISAAGLTTSWAACNGVFRLPRVLPPVVYLRIRISTAVSNTSSVYIDHCALSPMSELYTAGIYAALFSGNADFAAGDMFTISATNDRAGEFQTWFDRNFDMRAKRLLLPSSGSETISDTLIG